MPTILPRFILPAAMAASLMVLVSACGREEAVRRQDSAPIPVTTAAVSERPWNDVVLALGTIKARESVTVTAKVSETVQTVHFDSGDEVKAGAPLVTLTGQQQQASLTAAEATADEAERLYKRQDELSGQQLISRSTLDTQRSVRDSARAQVAEIRANLSDRVIRAPFAGVLGIRQVSEGALVTPGTSIATLDDVDRVYADFPVPETQLAALAAGQAVEGTSAAYPGRTFEGTVSTVDTRVDAATRAVTVRADFPNADRALRPGMLMRTRLQLPDRPTLVIPEIAVVQVGDASFVYRVRADDTVERADVELGTRRSGLVAVTKGLETGQRIVVDGTGKVRPGAKVAEGTSAPRAAPAVDARG